LSEIAMDGAGWPRLAMRDLSAVLAPRARHSVINKLIYFDESNSQRCESCGPAKTVADRISVKQVFKQPFKQKMAPLSLLSFA